METFSQEDIAEWCIRSRAAINEISEEVVTADHKLLIGIYSATSIMIPMLYELIEAQTEPINY